MPVPEAPTIPMSPEFQQFKASLHRAVLDRLNLESLNRLGRDTAVQGVRSLVADLMNQEVTPLSTAERRLIVDEIVNEIFGLGPLEPLLADPTINDILVNSHAQVFVERNG